MHHMEQGWDTRWLQQQDAMRQVQRHLGLEQLPEQLPEPPQMQQELSQQPPASNAAQQQVGLDKKKKVK